MSFESPANFETDQGVDDLIYIVPSTEKQKIKFLRKAGLIIRSINPPGPDPDKNYPGRRYDEVYFYMQKPKTIDQQPAVSRETDREEDYFG